MSEAQESEESGGWLEWGFLDDEFIEMRREMEDDLIGIVTTWKNSENAVGKG